MLSHPTLLPHLKEELNTMCTRLYLQLIRLFPALPRLGHQAWIANPADEELFPVSGRSLLLPIILPSIYPTIFHLYHQREERLDKEYWERLLRWNKHSDAALLAFFDVDVSVWEGASTSRRSREELFKDAAFALQRLKTTFVPAEKVEVIISMFKAITEQTGAGNHTWNTDSLLPVGHFFSIG